MPFVAALSVPELGTLNKGVIPEHLGNGKPSTDGATNSARHSQTLAFAEEKQ